jgi:MinD superfamily P-loop ATPase
MKITIFSLKGGVGKTMIAINLALNLHYELATNEVFIPLEEIIKGIEIKKILPEGKFDTGKNQTIFDLGGYADKRIEEIISISDFCIVPVVNESELSVKVSLNSLQICNAINKNTVVVLNKFNIREDSGFLHFLKENFKNEIFPIKFSKGFQSDNNILELARKNKFFNYLYKEPATQFKKLLNHLTGDGK